MQRIQQQPAFVLHRRPYRNTSLLVDLFTRDYGRVSLIARSARGPRSRFKGIIEPFVSLEVNWAGRNDLKYLQQLEYSNFIPSLCGSQLMIGFYINELLYRLLASGMPFYELYHDYEKFIKYMTQRDEPRCRLVLCYFELRLLNYLGYGLTLDKTINGDLISPDEYYYFAADSGFELVSQGRRNNPQVFKGSSMLSLLNNCLLDADVDSARRLLQISLRSQLGSKPLNSTAIC